MQKKDYFLYILFVVSSAVFFYALVAPWNGTVWLRPEACMVLTRQETRVQKLEGDMCLWVGKFDNGFTGIRLHTGKRLTIPFHQIIAYDIEN
jgi:hypothetical protein